MPRGGVVPSKRMYVILALFQVVLLIEDQLPAHALVIRERDDRVHDFASIGARLIRRYPFFENFAAEIFVFFVPRPRLFGGRRCRR